LKPTAWTDQSVQLALTFQTASKMMIQGHKLQVG